VEDEDDDEEEEYETVVVVVEEMGVEAAERSLRRKALARPSDIAGDGIGARE
jgi:hypothetical protein